MQDEDPCCMLDETSTSQNYVELLQRIRILEKYKNKYMHYEFSLYKKNESGVKLNEIVEPNTNNSYSQLNSVFKRIGKWENT